MITLRDYARTDVERLASLANNKNVSKYLVYTFPYPYTWQDAEWWIETGSKENGMIAKVIEYRGEFAGSVGLKPQEGWREHLAEIGYWVGENYRRRGVAPAALKMMSEYAFGELGFKKLFAPVLGPNKAPMRVLEKMRLYFGSCYGFRGLQGRGIFGYLSLREA